jgi:hypothetical protein
MGSVKIDEVRVDGSDAYMISMTWLGGHGSRPADLEHDAPSKVAAS